eukprot:1139454-Pelagomonas_calceolata.AAC.3
MHKRAGKGCTALRSIQADMQLRPTASNALMIQMRKRAGGGCAAPRSSMQRQLSHDRPHPSCWHESRCSSSGHMWRPVRLLELLACFVPGAAS